MEKHILCNLLSDSFFGRRGKGVILGIVDKITAIGRLHGPNICRSNNRWNTRCRPWDLVLLNLEPPYPTKGKRQPILGKYRRLTKAKI